MIHIHTLHPEHKLGPQRELLKSNCHRIDNLTVLYHNKRRLQAIRLDGVKESFKNIPDFKALPLSSGSSVSSQIHCSLPRR